MPGLQDAFKHESLRDAAQQIRLLRFTGHATDENETISCELSAVNISECPPYAAISYTWGPVENPRQIKINGKDIEVNQNCHYALTQVAGHLQSGLRYFWLDSICINQQDLDEKALQVEMMADIYTRAQMVLSCVGPHAENSELVLPMVKQMATWIRAQPEEMRYRQSLAMDHLDEVQAVDGNKDLEFGRKLTAAYVTFGNRTYWQRMWIVQEARLARSCIVFCGPDTIDLADFATFLRAFMNDRAADTDFFLSTWLLTDMWRVIAGSSHLPRRAEADGNVRPLPISKALERFDQHKATNFRDRLYALGKVAEWPDGKPQPKPDYRISKLALVREVLQRLAPVDWAEHRCCIAIARLVSAFGLTVEEPEISAFITQMELPRETRPAASSAGRLPLLYAGEFLRRPAGCRIRAAPGGRLTANILNSAKGRALFEGEKSRVWSSNAGRALFVESEVGGYLPPEAQAGDVLLQIEDGNGVPIWLVIRQDHGEDGRRHAKFNIVGPALANPGFQLHASERTGYMDVYDHSDIPKEQRDLPSVFDLWFDQDEFLIWRAWVHSFESGTLNKDEVIDEFLAGKRVPLNRSWAVLRENGTDWTLDR